ncbi:hypothetical protein [Nocardia asteroides]|uniref:hypothetical protein n=1 Tax=Nocardia asteroides TaxID=1824 RepID=UPI001E34F384|nr:hypothetical protein [Nocardia asteroides]UGT53346.1 hypothetical protein LTT85_22000 [Nocardia asteroides]
MSNHQGMTDSPASALDWLPEPLAAVSFRLARVHQAAEALGALAAHWSRSGPVELAQDEDGERWVARVVGIRPVPPLAALLFSEAIHHLRAAVENTLFYLVENERGTQLTEQHARAVELPVVATEQDFRAWQNKVARKVPELGVETKLGRRVGSLQPYTDTISKVPSMPTRMAALSGARVEYEHPLRLLQRYSNLDKHRSLRFCAAATIVTTTDVDMKDTDLTFRSLEVGTELASTTPGKMIGLELNSALMIERPDSAVRVGPVAELTHLHRHVADVVVPTLVRGLSAPRAFPPQIELGDTGDSVTDRLSRAEGKLAHERWDEDTSLRMFEAWQTEPRVLPPPR